MKICPINILTSINFKNNKINSQNAKPQIESFEAFDSFERSSFGLIDFLDKEDKLQISEYLKLSDRDKVAIRSLINPSIQETVLNTIEIAKPFKKVLDEEYGENGYVFISIGTSPSLITKALECMGVEVRYLPITNLGKISAATFKKYFYKDYFREYENFLKSQGISKKDIESNDKKYLFYDYTNNRTSLDRFERIARQLFELESDKVEFRSINRHLLAAFKNKYPMDFLVNEYIDRYMRYSEAELCSSIQHLNILTDIKKPSNYTQRNLTRHYNLGVQLFNFAIMDELNKEDLLKENSNNRIAL